MGMHGNEHCSYRSVCCDQGKAAGPHGRSSGSQAQKMCENSMTAGTGCFISMAGRIQGVPRDSHRLSTRDIDSKLAGPSAYSAAASSRQAPAAVQLAGGRCMAVGTGCFIPSM